MSLQYALHLCYFFQEYDISKVHVGELKPLVYILHASWSQMNNKITNLIIIKIWQQSSIAEQKVS